MTRRLKRVLVLLFLLVGMGVVAVWVGPGLVLRLLSFSPEGNVNEVFSRLEATRATATAAMFSPTSAAINLPQETDTPSPTRTPLEASPDVDSPIATQATFAPTLPAASSPDALLSMLFPQAAGSIWAEGLRRPETLRIRARGFVNLTMETKDISAQTLLFGDMANRPFGVMVFRETDLKSICDLFFNGCVNQQYKVSSIDFRAGGVIVYGSINVAELFWQDVGVAMVLETDEAEIPYVRVLGLVLDNVLYSLPETGSLTEQILGLLERGNNAIKQLEIRADRQPYALAEVHFDDDEVMLVLQ